MDRLPLYRCPLHARVEGSCLQAGSARWHRGFLTRWLAVVPRRSDRAVVPSLSAFEKKPASFCRRASTRFLLRCASDTHVSPFSYWNLVRYFHLIEKSISAYTFVNRIHLAERASENFIRTRSRPESLGPWRTRERTLSVFLPLSFQSTASERRGVTCCCTRFRAYT